MNGYTRLIDAKAASRILGVPPTWLLAQARAGRIPHHRLGHHVRFSPDDLSRWREANRIDPDGPAGSVARWLADRALREPQEATVRVRLSHGRGTGVYALCAAQVALGTEDRARIGGVHYRTQPAILLAQIARSVEEPGIGSELLRHADASSRQALRYVGATVMVVDPFDEDTAEMWRQRFGFQDSEQPVPGHRRLRRQRLSLQQ